MTNRIIYREYLQQLRQIYSENEAAVITDWVFEKIANLKRADIIKNPDQPITNSISGHLNDCLAELLLHKPVQYVLGEAWFYKMKFRVNEQVLIPRPETEELVHLVLDSVEKGKGEIQSVIINAELNLRTQTPLIMLDIGTGSGCIAIAVKKNLPEITMYAVDVSKSALSVAKENAFDHQTDIKFLLVDFLDENNWKDLPVFDIIISNPPYIPLNERIKLDKNVADFEPYIALFVPDNAQLMFYKKIADFGKTHLRSKGKIYVEIHENFAKETREVFEDAYTVEIKQDIFKKERMLVATRIVPAL